MPSANVVQVEPSDFKIRDRAFPTGGFHNSLHSINILCNPINTILVPLQSRTCTNGQSIHEGSQQFGGTLSIECVAERAPECSICDFGIRELSFTSATVSELHYLAIWCHSGLGVRELPPAHATVGEGFDLAVWCHCRLGVRELPLAHATIGKGFDLAIWRHRRLGVRELSFVLPTIVANARVRVTNETLLANITLLVQVGVAF